MFAQETAPSRCDPAAGPVTIRHTQRDSCLAKPAGLSKANSLFRHSRWDALLVVLAAAHAGTLLFRPTLLLIALGMWWNSNTIAHYFVHLPFFRLRLFNRCFSVFLSMVLGVPQRLWRERHLAHHAARHWRFQFSGQLLLETGCVIGLWTWMVWHGPRFFWGTYLPGWLLGLGLCQLQGHYEH